MYNAIAYFYKKNWLKDDSKWQLKEPTQNDWKSWLKDDVNTWLIQFKEQT